MVTQVLTPAMKHGNEADLGTQVPRIGGDCAQRFGRRFEQDGVDRCLVLGGDLGSWCRQREDDVEIGRRQ
jgi:hypothetical protein